MEGIEYFDHTADIGMRVCAPTFDELLTKSVGGLVGLIVSDVESIRANEEREMALAPCEPLYQLVDLLREVLYRFETDGFLVRESEALQQPDGGWLVKFRGEAFDPARHEPNHEVKAVTYHGLVVEETKDGWRAEVIFDI